VESEELNEGLFRAVFDDNLDDAKSYLSRGAQADWVNEKEGFFNNAPLHIAAWHGNSHMCRLLLKHGAPTEVENQFCNTPLIFASYYGMNGAVQALIDGGSDVNVMSSGSGLTALHKACMQGFPETAKILLGAGAFPDALDKQGRAPLDVIGVEGERNPNNEETRTLKALLADPEKHGGKRVTCQLHPEHTLAMSLAKTHSAECLNCAEAIPKGARQFTCTTCPERANVRYCRDCALHDGEAQADPSQSGSIFQRILACQCLG